MQDWDIQSRAHACTACLEPFADKQTYHTLLSFGPTGYERRDLCTECFPQATRDAVVSYWQGEYKLPAARPPEPIGKENAETLLRKLIESADPSQAAPRYILAVMLERKKLLKHRDTIHDDHGNESLVYEHALTGESFTIPDPRLKLDELTEVQQQVSALLSAPAAPVAETPAPAADVEKVEAGPAATGPASM